MIGDVARRSHASESSITRIAESVAVGITMESRRRSVIDRPVAIVVRP